jgi:hypothetical protein
MATDLVDEAAPAHARELIVEPAASELLQLLGATRA